jgi:FlaA1/EpsC-like NDP-sugar epimerase
MIRVFSHYISVRTVCLMLLEALVLLLAMRSGLALHLGEQQSLFASSTAVILYAAAMVLGILLVMNSMGLYQLDESRSGVFSVSVRLLAALGVCLAVAYGIVWVTPSLDLRLNGWAITLIVALLGCAAIRALVYTWGNHSLFKPRVLVLGTGTRVGKLVENEQSHQTTWWWAMLNVNRVRRMCRLNDYCRPCRANR